MVAMRTPYTLIRLIWWKLHTNKQQKLEWWINTGTKCNKNYSKVQSLDYSCVKCVECVFISGIQPIIIILLQLGTFWIHSPVNKKFFLLFYRKLNAKRYRSSCCHGYIQDSDTRLNSWKMCMFFTCLASIAPYSFFLYRSESHSNALSNHKSELKQRLVFVFDEADPLYLVFGLNEKKSRANLFNFSFLSE